MLNTFYSFVKKDFFEEISLSLENGLGCSWISFTTKFFNKSLENCNFYVLKFLNYKK
jgi:hypothetical protein